MYVMYINKIYVLNMHYIYVNWIYIYTYMHYMFDSNIRWNVI